MLWVHSKYIEQRKVKEMGELTDFRQDIIKSKAHYLILGLRNVHLNSVTSAFPLILRTQRQKLRLECFLDRRLAGPWRESSNAVWIKIVRMLTVWCIVRVSQTFNAPGASCIFGAFWILGRYSISFYNHTYMIYFIFLICNSFQTCLCLTEELSHSLSFIAEFNILKYVKCTLQ